MKVVWSRKASIDRKNAYDFLDKESPRSAVETDNAVLEQVRLLADYPESGRSGRVAGTRELAISGTRYIAIYRIIGRQVRLIRLLHSAQQWP